MVSMTGLADQQVNEAVRISIPALVRLNEAGRNLPLKASHVLARQGGNYGSPFKGRGMEYDESRLYQPGDDIRNLDWRVTARSGRPYTKLFREERERPVFLWVDYRAAMFFATRGSYKAVRAAELASILAWSANNNGDRIGGIIFSDDVHKELKPKRGKAAVLQIINHLVKHPSWHETGRKNINDQAGIHALMRLRRVSRPGSLIFLFSDFRNLNDAGRIHLAQLSQHNDVVIIFIYDRLERDLPPAGLYRMSDGTQEIEIDTSNRRFLNDYSARFSAHRDSLEKICRSCRITMLSCTTEDDPRTVLARGLGADRRR